MPTDCTWIRVDHRHAVLQLIAKADSTSRLIVATARLKTTGDDLVHQPTVDQHIDARIRGLDLDHPQEGTPVHAHRIQFNRSRPETPVPLYKLGGVLVILSCTQSEHHILAIRVRYFQHDLHCTAGIKTAAESAGQTCAF